MKKETVYAILIIMFFGGVVLSTINGVADWIPLFFLGLEVLFFALWFKEFTEI